VTVGPSSAQAALAGVRVLEVGSFIAGPYCGMQLADLGADVIKVEPPNSGDEMRHIGPFVGDESFAFLLVNRNKRSLALDLKRPEGRDAFEKLVGSSDVIVENLRPGAMADLGLGYEHLASVNPRLIYVAVSGWGQTGPLSALPGLDIMAQAHGGLMSITGQPDQPPVKVGIPVCDLVCGLYGAIASISALRLRERTSRGQFIDVNLLESAVSLAVWEAARVFGTDEIPQRLGSAHQAVAPYQAVRSQDGWFTIGVSTPRQWTAFCGALGLERIELMPDYTDVNLRLRNRVALIAEIERVTIGRPMQEWIERLRRAGVPCAPINDYGKVFSDQHLEARGFFWETISDRGATVRQLGSAMRFSPGGTARNTAGPLLGRDSEAILIEIGYSRETVDGLLVDGIIGVPGGA